MTPSSLRDIDEKLCGMVEEKPAPDICDFRRNSPRMWWLRRSVNGRLDSEWYPQDVSSSLDACMKVYEEFRRRGWRVWLMSQRGPKRGAQSNKWVVELENEETGAEAYGDDDTLPLAFAKALLAAGEGEKG